MMNATFEWLPPGLAGKEIWEGFTGMSGFPSVFLKWLVTAYT